LKCGKYQENEKFTIDTCEHSYFIVKIVITDGRPFAAS